MSVLNKAQELIDKRKAQIEALDQLTQSVFLEMFGDPKTNPKNWDVIPLGELFEIKTGGTPSRENKNYWQNGKIPWVKTTEIKENTILVTEEYITEEGLRNSNAVLLPKNTILIAMYGQGKTRGRTAKLGIEATTNQACAAILPCKEHNPDFIWRQLMMQYQTLRDLGRGGNQPNLNLTLIKQFKIIVPPLSQQNTFAKIIQKIEFQKDLLQKSLVELENNFNSLMQRAFKGELFND
ncbi:restriction endonuclease subunit S [Geobacillus sp. Geo 8.1]